MSGDDKTELDQGTLLTPDNAIDTTHRHDQAEGDVPQPERTRCGPASSSTRGCCCGTERNVLTVPSRAVQHGPDSLYVYVVKPNSTVAAAGRWRSHGRRHVMVITKGLEDGQTVVTDGQSRLQEGTRVAANDAAQQAARRPKPGG